MHWDGSDYQLWTVLQAGGGNTQITFGAQWKQQPDVSADYARIAYQQNFARLMVADIDGANATDITPAGVAACSSPHWSPVARRIVFIGDEDLRAINDDGSNHVLLEAGAAGTERTRPSYNHDGSLIVYYRQTGALTVALRKINADGTGAADLDSPVIRAGGYPPNWLHAANTIAYGVVDPLDNQLLKINADGTGRTRITTGPSPGINSFQRPAIVPDDSFGVIGLGIGGGNTQIWKVPLNGSGQSAFAAATTKLYSGGDGPLVYGSRVYWIKRGAATATLTSYALDGSDERADAPATPNAANDTLRHD